MIFIPKGRIVKGVGILFLMSIAVVSSAFGKVVLGIYGGGTLSSPTQFSAQPDWETASTWAAGSHFGYFIQFYNQAGHWGLSLEALWLKYKETPIDSAMESTSGWYPYLAASLEYSFIWKRTQRLIPFIGLGLMYDPILEFFKFSRVSTPAPPEIDLKTDIGLKFKIYNFIDLKAQLFYALENKLLACSLGIDFTF